jgi:hypothetical protein
MEDLFKDLDLQDLKEAPIIGENDTEIPQDDPKKDENKSETEDPASSTEGAPSESDDIEVPIDSDNKTDTDSPFILLASALKEEGVSLSDEEIKEIKDAKSLVNTLKKAISESEYDGLSETQKKYLEAIRNGIPEEEVKTALKMEDLLTNKITPEAVENAPDLQEGLLLQYYKAKGIDDKEAQDLIEAKKTKGTLKETSLEAYKALQAQAKSLLEEKLKAKEEEAKKIEEEQKKKLEELKSNILKKEEIIPGVKLDNKTKEEIFSIMTTPVDKDENGNPLNAIEKARKENYEEVESVLAYIYYQTDGFKNLKGLKAPIRNSAIDELDKAVKTSSGVYNKPETVKSKETKELLKYLDSMFK